MGVMEVQQTAHSQNHIISDPEQQEQQRQHKSWFPRCGASLSTMTIVQACYLGVAAMLGTLLRLILAQLFGQACQNPGTIGWIADDAVLCVTASGETSQQGGIIFADLPANLLGSFLMGLFQDGSSLNLAIGVPLAFLSPSHFLQAYTVFHLAFKTGFCGSLTTFSGWNSEMVIMLVGGSEANTNRPTQFWKALLGYIVGIETALGSYAFGRTVAWWLHQWNDPDLAYEQEAMNVRSHQHGIAMNRKLPTLERRFLHGLFEEDSHHYYTAEMALIPPHEAAHRLDPASNLTQEELAPLRRWRESTQDARRVEHGLSEALMEMETALIVHKQVVTQTVRDSAIKHGWDIASLEEWLAKRYHPQELYGYDETNNLDSSGIRVAMVEETTVWYSIPVAILCIVVCLAILVVLMFHWNDETAYDITYRTMAYSMLYSTPGVLLRWKLSEWNGQFKVDRWKWLPIGTLTANILGAMVSITTIAWEYNLQMADVGGFWGIATLRAIKIGFSGCLTTVSTFMSEIHKLTQTRQDRGYKYILITLSISCLVSVILFVVIV